MAPSINDPFDVLGVPARFDLPAGELRAAFLARSGALHPDISAGTGAPGEDEEGGAAALNDAKRVLENPESRAEALLNRLGGPRKEEDRSLPADFLQEMMEVREEIEAAGATRDQGALAKWESWAEDRRRGHMARVKGLFAGISGMGGGGEVDFATRRAIRTELNMWRYVERLIEQLEVDESGGGGGGGRA